jgi:VCBS repeat-containing protein
MFRPSFTLPIALPITLSRLALATSALLISACGGGGGGAAGGGSVAVISGVAAGTVSSGTSEAAGNITVTDADAGQATFAQPASMVGAHGTWSLVVSGSTAVWRYTLTKAPASNASESLVIKSQDGSASLTVSVNILSGAVSSDLVTSVPEPAYAGNYAAEKVAVFNRLNDDRARCGFGKLAQNSKLDLAAQNHADYISSNGVSSHNEDRDLPGYTGFDVASRLNYVGYQFSKGNEIISSLIWGAGTAGNTTNNAVSVKELLATNLLRGLYATVYHLAGAMSSNRDAGIGIASKQTGFDSTFNIKPLVIKSGTNLTSVGQLTAQDEISTFPCNGIMGMHPVFGNEDPDPFPAVDRDVTPYGQPVYVMSGPNTSIVLNAGTITLRGGAAVPTTTLSAANDPQKQLQGNQVFLVPTVRLADNAIYDVALSGTSTGLVSPSNPTGTWTKSFSFTTGTVLSE